MKCGRPVLAVVVCLVAVAVYRVLFSRSQPLWHQGPLWEHFLTIYDERANAQFHDCDRRLVPSIFGSTQVYACGKPDSEASPVLLLHGAVINSLMFGDWLVPPLAERHYTVCLDYVCDVGRSSPLNGSVANCPQTEQDFVVWVRSVLSTLHIERPVSLIGFSYGSFVAATVARLAPELVDRLILLSPAGVVAPLEFAFMWRAVVSKMLGIHTYILRYMSTDPNFDARVVDEADEALTAMSDADVSYLPMNPYSFPDHQLRQM